MTITAEKLIKLISEDDMIEILTSDEEVEFEDWDCVECGYNEDWDGTAVYDDIVYYSALIEYRGNSKFSITYKIGWEEFDYEDEIVEYIQENYPNY